MLKEQGDDAAVIAFLNYWWSIFRDTRKHIGKLSNWTPETAVDLVSAYAKIADEGEVDLWFNKKVAREEWHNKLANELSARQDRAFDLDETRVTLRKKRLSGGVVYWLEQRQS